MRASCVDGSGRFKAETLPGRCGGAKVAGLLAALYCAGASASDGVPRNKEAVVGEASAATPDQQGQGLGSALLDRIEQLAPPGARTFRLLTGVHSAANLAFYRRRGYLEVRREERPESTVVILERVVGTG